MKDTFTLILSCILLLTTFNSNADQNKTSLDLKIKQFEKEFIKDNYENLGEFHNIITLCNATPDKNNFDDWLNKHSNDEDLNIEHMKQQVKECKHVLKKGYQQLENIYRKSLMFNKKESKFILASLIPFTSQEKISLLSDSAYWSSESVEILARISINNVDKLSHVKRYFWLSISNANSFYPEEYGVAMIDLNSAIEPSDLLTINNLIVDWQGSSEVVRKDIIRKIDSLIF